MFFYAKIILNMKKDKKVKKGFSLVEIMIVVAIIVILALISIPNLLRARITAKETLAKSSLRSISTAMIAYKISNSTYLGVTLSVLSNTTPPYIDSMLGSGKKEGYDFTLTPVSADTYVCVATPESQGISGVCSFCVSEDGVIRVRAAGGAIADHSACMDLSPVGP